MDRNTTTYDDLPDMEDSFAVERWAWGALYGELRYEIKELAIHLQKLKEDYYNRHTYKMKIAEEKVNHANCPKIADHTGKLHALIARYKHQAKLDETI